MSRGFWSTGFNTSEGPVHFETENFWDELDALELGYGPMIAMFNENEYGPEHAYEVITVRAERAEFKRNGNIPR